MSAIVDDGELAADLSRTAGEVLLELQERGHRTGRSGWWLEDAGDSAAHDHLVGRLAEERPEDPVLSEEGFDGGQRLDGDRAWIVDPLDGSQGFGSGGAEWAVHVALTTGGVVSAAAVAVPHLDLVASTVSPPTRRVDDRPLVVVTGRSRAWVDGQVVAHALDAELVSCGSAGVKAMLVATGRADVYVHAAPLYEWDVCAPAAVAEAAGMIAVAPDGSPFVFNRETPVVPGLVVATPDLVDATLAALARGV